MPPMKCCRKTWSVGSDDFVISSVAGIIFHTVWLGGLIAFTIIVLVGRDCFPDGPREKLVFAFIYSQIAIQVLVIISEGLICLVSSRGTISNPKPRRYLPHFLRLRAILYALEILGILLGCYVAWSPYIQDNIECERANQVKQALEAYVISVIVIHVIIAILFMVYFDPLGLQTPSLLKELHVNHDETDDDDIVVEVKKVQRKRYGNKTIKVDEKKVGKRLYSASSRQQWTRRVRVLCCCAGGNNNRSKVQALEDIAHAMATMFDGVEIVPTDFVAALMLVHRDQKEQMKRQCDLGAQLKTITYDHMDDSQLTPGYQKNVPDCKIDFYLPDIRLLLQDLRHYLKFALGIYGWPIHVYMNPLAGSLCLCAHLKCRAVNRRAKDFAHDNCCLANTVALQLRSTLTDNDVIYVSYKNENEDVVIISEQVKEEVTPIFLLSPTCRPLSVHSSFLCTLSIPYVHLPPFSLCYDHPRKAVVLSIRGSMSLRDALTDMNMSMKSVKVNDLLYKNRSTKVHAGMYRAARNIIDEVDEKLNEALLSHQDYQFIITGHSLGAGVGAILAVLYREEFPNLHCYAFSPPGSLFTLPLVEYSKSFITTVIYGNDIVPRLTFRGLLYLKRNMTHLIELCSLPKHAILFPTLFSCCYRQHHHTNHPRLKDADIYNHSTEAGVFKTPVDSSHGMPLQQNTPRMQHMADVTGSAQLARKYGKMWLEKSKESTLHKFVEKMYTVEQAPAFVPGKVLHIKETGKRIRRRFWNVIGEKEVCAMWKSNDEFCHIVVDTGLFDHHMPDSVQGAVERLYHHQVHGKEKLPDAAAVTIQRNARRAKTVGATIDKSSDNKKKQRPRVQYFRSNTEPEGLSNLAPEPVCRVDGTNSFNVKDTITATEVNGDTHKVVKMQDDTVEVTVHIAQEGDGNESTDV